jgi:glycerol-3-phosphate acyltransferase PlsY
MDLIVAGALGFLLGSVPFGLLLTRAAGLGDIRSIGSGSIGATNVLRTGNKALAAGTVLLDGLKGTVAVLLAAWLLGPSTAGVAAVASVLGHCYTPWLGFRGGKGIATALGAFLALAWPLFVVAGLVWLISAKVTRISSVSGLSGMGAAALLAWILGGGALGWPVLLILAVVVLRHEANIRRLLAGTEPRIGEGK